jgi:hypothetical protein
LKRLGFKTYFLPIMDFENGYAFLCNQSTEQECLTHMIFGAQQEKMNEMRCFTAKTAIFLYRIGKAPRLYGIFIANGIAFINLEPSFFGGKFPAQIRVRHQYNFSKPLTEETLKVVFAGNTRWGNRLLNHKETNMLMQAFIRHNNTPAPGGGILKSTAALQSGNPLVYTTTSGAQIHTGATSRLATTSAKGQGSNHFSFLQWSNLLSEEKKKNLALETELEYARCSTRKLEYDLAAQRKKCLKCPPVRQQVQKLRQDLKQRKSELASLRNARMRSTKKIASNVKNCEPNNRVKRDLNLLQADIDKEEKKRAEAEDEFRREEKEIEEEEVKHNRIIKKLEKLLLEEQQKVARVSKELELRICELRQKDETVKSLKKSSTQNELHNDREETQRLLKLEQERVATIQKELDEALNGFVNERMKKSETQQALETVLAEKRALQKELCAEKARTLKRETEYDEERERGLQNTM